MVSHPLSMREALGSIPSVSMFTRCAWQVCFALCTRAAGCPLRPITSCGGSGFGRIFMRREFHSAPGCGALGPGPRHVTILRLSRVLKLTPHVWRSARRAGKAQIRRIICVGKTLWPSGLRRWLKAPVRKGVGSNPTGVICRGGKQTHRRARGGENARCATTEQAVERTFAAPVGRNRHASQENDR